MCTLILYHRCVPATPILVGANRDEYLDRPAAPPALRPEWLRSEPSQGQRRGEASIPVAAPLDLRSGGTWLGINGRGLFAAITNRPTPGVDPSRTSRGSLVPEALRFAKAVEAADHLVALPPATFNPFNLVVADAEHAFVVVYEDSPRLADLPPGVHVIGNADPDDRGVPKIAGLLDRTETLVNEPADRVDDGLRRILTTHEGGAGPLDDTCIHTTGYGTRSSTLLRIGEPDTRSSWWFAEGAPCETGYQDHSFLLTEIGAGNRSGLELTRGPNR